MTQLGFFSPIALSSLDITGSKIYGLFIYSSNTYWAPTVCQRWCKMLKFQQRIKENVASALMEFIIYWGSLKVKNNGCIF